MPSIDDSLFDITASLKRKSYKQKTSYYKCDKMGCLENALYKAPKNPENLSDYYRFCLTHVRDYNKSWNFFAGRSDEDIAYHLEQDIIGHRPTWPMGNIPRTGRDKRQKPQHFFDSHFHDPFDIGKKIFGDTQKAEAEAKRKKEALEQAMLASSMKQACEILEIKTPPDLQEARKNYKRLVKKYHPDVNKDNPDAERILRTIVEAYRTLENSLK